MNRKRLERVTCTLPGDLVKAADAIAAREGRSRSWVVAEALRVFVAGCREAADSAAGRVSEAGAPSYEVREAFEAASRAQLEEELRMTPEERVLIADDLAVEAARIRPQPQVRQVVAFESWEDFLAWKKSDILW